MRNLLAWTSLVVLVGALGVGCTERMPTSRRDAGPGGSDGSIPSSMCIPGGSARVCLGPTEISCNPDGTESGRRSCTDSGLTCAPGIGCAVCFPDRGNCEGNTVQRCRADGSGYDDVVTCDASAGEACNPGLVMCTSPCAEAEASNSYIGCEYWPVPTLNTQLDRAAFAFAVVVSNPQTAPASVTITRAGAPVTTRMVAAGAVETIELPWVTQLQTPLGEETSALVRGGAYRLVSTLPVTVYQFNPLEYQSGSTFSHTNDASLLLPTHVLTGNYMALSRETMLLEQVDTLFGGSGQSRSPGYMTIAAVDEGNTSVRIQFSSDVVASGDGSVRAFTRGESGTFMLSQGDVLQIVAGAPRTCDRSGGSDAIDPFTDMYYCRVTQQFDLTGSEIRASQRVALISGHNCDFVPYNRWACDHLEEQIFPEDVWGRDYILSAPQPLRSEPYLVRVLSGTDGNMITVDPASAQPPVVLNRGQYVEFSTNQSVSVSGTAAILVGQFLVGQDFAGIGTSGMAGQGDPAMSLGIPTDQFRSEYAFLAPSSYTSSFVNVVAPMTASVTLDGTAVTGFTAIGTTGFGVARVSITPGAHQISGTAPFGIVVYGYANYTSYMYPGGLDLEVINPLI